MEASDMAGKVPYRFVEYRNCEECQARKGKKIVHCGNPLTNNKNILLLCIQVNA